MGSKTTNFDPLSYIENAFLDRKTDDSESALTNKRIGSEQKANPKHVKLKANSLTSRSEGKDTPKFRKTEMSAPRPRKAQKNKPKTVFVDAKMQELWDSLPRNLEFLFSFYDDTVTANYYRGEFKESRLELARRLIDPELSLEETSRLLGVCPATVRRYTNRGWIEHHRTVGGQRRFRLSNLVKFVELHGRFPKE